MAFSAKRRLLRLVTALLFAFSGVAYAYAATEVAVTAGNVAMEMPVPDDGMDCCGTDKTTRVSCVAMCATAIAILSDPVAVPFAVAVKGVESDPELLPSGRDPSLDPYPPKR
jgi:hypothetical protein